MSARRSQDIADIRPRKRLVSGELAMVIAASVGMLTSFDLLLAVSPKYAAAAGGGSGGAGLVTGVLLLGTVVAELASASLMRSHGYLRALVAGAALLGAPTLALLVSSSLAIMVAVSFVRGFGFGLSGVVAGAVVAELLPPDRRGEGLGLYGALDSAPGIVALPLGIWLADHYGFALVAVIAAAAALAPMAAFQWLRRATASLGGPAGPGGTADGLGAAASVEAVKPAGLVEGLRDRGQLRFALIFVTTTVAAGIVASFLPLAWGISANTAAAGLLAQALTGTISRWWAGRYGDRRGHERLLVPGLLMAALGMIAMLALTLPVAVMAGMSVFGIGFGMVQNATLALMMERVPASGIGAASALWNLAYDAGYGAGPAAFGLFVVHTGYPAGLALTGIPMIAALPLAWLGRRRRRAIREPADLTSGQVAGQMSSSADVEQRRSAPTTRCEAKSASLRKGVC
jgi:MFS family permease